LQLPCFCKDDVKEALFDVLGSKDREWSRLLSDASFAALARLAQAELAADRPCIVEGNWRAAHALLLRGILTGQGTRAAQIWCSAEPQEIVRRFTLRRRHAGHLDDLLPRSELDAAAAQPPEFMDLAGPRWVYRSDSAAAYAELLRALNSWRL
jgi:hypothetical protein